MVKFSKYYLRIMILIFNQIIHLTWTKLKTEPIFRHQNIILRVSFFSWVYYTNFHMHSDCRIKRLNKTLKKMRGWTLPWGVNLPLRTLNVPGVWPQCAKNLKCELELWKSNKLEVVWCHTLTLLQNSYWRAVFQSNKLSTHTYRYVCRH